jgi:Protein of unknown function (DUF3303)
LKPTAGGAGRWAAPPEYIPSGWLWTQEALAMPRRLYMVVEHFKNKDAVPVYRHFRDRGRLAPEGLAYVSSWVDETLERCYQLMECEDRGLLEEWIANWRNLVDFEVHEVMPSQKPAERMAPRL